MDIETINWGLVFAGAARDIIVALIALLATWGALRLLDSLGGKPFGGALNAIRGGSYATAIYYGLRFVGACLLVGLVLG